MLKKQLLFNSLYIKIKTCQKCRLWETRKNVVLGEGNVNAKLLFVAQAPGKNEDEKGKIFIGPAGKIFFELLKIAEIEKGEIFITNLLKCFLPKYRRPKWDEIYNCKNYLFEELNIIQPKLISPLGYYSTRVILEYYHFPIPERRNDYNKIFGKIFSRDNLIIIPLPHPALIFHDKQRKQGLIKGFQILGKIYKKYSWNFLFYILLF